MFYGDGSLVRLMRLLLLYLSHDRVVIFGPHIISARVDGFQYCPYVFASFGVDIPYSVSNISSESQHSICLCGCGTPFPAPYNRT
jgi:hypothetical protein